MNRLSKSTRHSLLAAGALFALFAAVHRDAVGEAPPAARIPSSTKVASLTQSAQATGETAIQRRKDLLLGDASLQGDFDLKDKSLVEDHFEVALSDGARAVLTLDPKVQAAAEKVIRQARSPMAAVVVMRTNGELLAIAGRRFEQAVEEDKEAGIKASPESEEWDSNLALGVWAPAASVFKVVTASALMRAGVKPDAKVCYHGGLRSVVASNLVDSKQDSACNDLGYAVAKSQNAVIAKLAHKKLDPERLGEMASDFGFGSAPKFALDAEASRVKLPEDDLEFAKVAAGFWSSEISALGGADIANVVASGGMRVSPRIVAEVHEKTRSVAVVAKHGKRVLPERIAKSVAQMMAGTVKSGTAFKGFHDKRGRPYLSGTPVAGKTGSLSRNTPSYLAYSWFVGFAPVENPEVVISVVLGNSALWHLKAHTAARLVLDSLY